MDEAYIGGLEEGVKGRRTETKALVVIAIAAEEDGPGIGRIRMKTVPDASADSLMGFVRDSVEIGARLHTDGWPSYGSAKQHFGAREN